MNFRPEMVAAIRRGQKTETRRVANLNPNSPWCRERCGYRMPKIAEPEEKSYAICPGRGKTSVGRLQLIEEPELTLVENITDLGAYREGFEDREEFLAYFRKLHPRISLKAEVWRVHFKPVSWVPDVDALIEELMAA